MATSLPDENRVAPEMEDVQEVNNKSYIDAWEHDIAHRKEDVQSALLAPWSRAGQVNQATLPRRSLSIA